MTSTRLADSPFYAELWGSPEVRAIFTEHARLQGWLDVVGALARAQAAEDIIPPDAATSITRYARVEHLDLDYAVAETHRSAHSTLGLIHALQAVLPPTAREYVYVGASVQDITDTWTSTAIRRVGAIAWRDLRRVEELLLTLAHEHRDTAMTGRTHGQPAAPITFGWKAASWAEEIRRHLHRLRDGAPRWLVGQLGGGAGTLVYHGRRGLAVRERFCAELGLADPGISWLTARDRVAEFAQVLTLVCGTLARIGTEVYELARPEIGELAEPASNETVGSITMPHKRNPERSEHLDTLARLVRGHTGVLLEAMVQQHERDGRGWKTEWVALPEVCLLASTSLQLATEILDGLEVRTQAMARNLRRHGEYAFSEQALAKLAPRLGHPEARTQLHTALERGREAGQPFAAALVDAGLFTTAEAEELTAQPDTGACAPMVDAVIAGARAARASEPESWP